MDDGSGVNRRHAPQIGLTEHRMVAAATSSPATRAAQLNLLMPRSWRSKVTSIRSEEHTSELQSRLHLVCRLLLEKKKKKTKKKAINNDSIYSYKYRRQ